ncbi:MAG: TolC family protein, partial [Pseudomonadota bacterium]
MVTLTGSKGLGRSGITAVVSTVVLIGCAAEPEDTQSVLTASDTIAGPSNSGKTAHGLTLRSAVRAALADSPEIGISDAQLDDARAAIDVAASERGPFVDLTASTGGENTYSEIGDTRGLNRSEINLSVERTVYDFGAIDQGIARRESLATAAEKTRLDKMETVALDTVFAYLDFLRNSQLAAVAVQNTQNHQRIFNLVEQNEAGGNATLADVNRAATRLEAAKSTQLDAQNAREDAIVVFRRLTNLSPAQVQVPPQLAPPERRLTAASRRAAILSNPELLALTNEREALERQLDQQLASRKPRFFVRGQGNLRDDVGGATGRAG